MRIYVIGALVVALIGAGGFLYLRGGSDERIRSNLEDATGYRAGRERIDDANAVDRSPDDVIERLRGHAQ